jgi:hypothetical protein
MFALPKYKPPPNVTNELLPDIPVPNIVLWRETFEEVLPTMVPTMPCVDAPLVIWLKFVLFTNNFTVRGVTALASLKIAPLDEFDITEEKLLSKIFNEADPIIFTIGTVVPVGGVIEIPLAITPMRYTSPLPVTVTNEY